MSHAEIIQDRLVAYLTTNADDLAIDAREVTIQRHMPEDALSQRSLPVVFVSRPTLSNVAEWGYNHRRKTYSVTLTIVEAEHVSIGKRETSDERLSQLQDNLIECLHQSTHLEMADLMVFESHVEYEIGEPYEVGNQLMAMPVTLGITITITDYR